MWVYWLRFQWSLWTVLIIDIWAAVHAEQTQGDPGSLMAMEQPEHLPPGFFNLREKYFYFL